MTPWAMLQYVEVVEPIGDAFTDWEAFASAWAPWRAPGGAGPRSARRVRDHGEKTAACDDRAGATAPPSAAVR